MNSLDKRYRDERDLKELLEIADAATIGFIAESAGREADRLRTRFEALRDRRQAEDAGQTVQA